MGNIDPILEGKNISRLVSGNKLLKFLNSRRKYSKGGKNQTEATDTTMASFGILEKVRQARDRSGV